MAQTIEYGNEGEFNQGLAIVYRLDTYSKALAWSIVSDNYEIRYRILMVMFNELYGVEGNPQTKKKYWDAYCHIQNKHRVWQKCRNQREVCSHDHPTHYLQCWELELRSWSQGLGLGMKKKSDGRYAMMG